LLDYSSDTRIIISVSYSEEKKTQCVKTDHAAQRDDFVNIEIGRRQVAGTPKGYLGKYIYTCINALTCSSAVEVDVGVIRLPREQPFFRNLYDG